jgi:bifunctional UDP-N-acetylglucosamine pyrophosphorylase/glucosamine-1-phosphate N-acetyltransferase
MIKMIHNVVTIILAAGKGTRMNSALPKVLHTVSGKPMIMEVVQIVRSIGVERVLAVLGHQADLVRQHLDGVEVVEQKELLGTAHAVAQTQERLRDFTGDILILNGDIPLIKPVTLERLIRQHKEQKASCTFLAATVDDPFGYGRVLRDAAGAVVGIIEERDASPSQRLITEVNAGIYCFDSHALFQAVEKIRPTAEKGEYYLTDAISVLAGQGAKVASAATENHHEALGINTKDDLVRAQSIAILHNTMRWQPAQKMA